jgi:adenine-specific DNA-methyltransferase
LVDPPTRNPEEPIYIDPPYNTGKEFIYPDKYQDNLETYLRYTGQVDAGGFKLSANAESGGRFHTNWLNTNAMLRGSHRKCRWLSAWC